MRILGIDPGTRRLGFGVIEGKGTRLTPLGYGVIDVSKIESFSARLLKIHQELQAIVNEFNPTQAALEQVFSGRNIKTAIVAAEGRGAIRLSLELSGLEVFEYAPTAVKRAVTGRGSARKEQVREMVTTLLSLRTQPSLDASDALAMALCHIHRAR